MAEHLSTDVLLSISCRDLIDMDVFSKSDPMVVLNEYDNVAHKWREIGRTEMVKNSLNPDFVKRFQMPYRFELMQKLRFNVYDIDNRSTDLEQQDFLGFMEASLGEIVSAGSFVKPLQLHGRSDRNCGVVIVYAEEVNNCKDIVKIRVEGDKLDRKDFFGSSDPFLSFYRIQNDGSTLLVHQTEVIKNTLKPKWKPMSISVGLLCQGDYNKDILIRCMDWNRSGDHSLIGEFKVNLECLRRGCQTKFELIHPKKYATKSKYTNSGFIIFANVIFEKMYSFIDYIQGSTELNCTFCIDFTASNGDPRRSGTLHYYSPYQPSPYAVALQAVGEIIADYDSDNVFPAFGFGAKIPPHREVSHLFPLDLNSPSGDCRGMEAVLSAYYRTLQSVEFYGPTNFAPSINSLAEKARCKMDGSEYHILLIITDGIITDMLPTKKAIVEASLLPISIIIIGVGDTDFSAMEELDGDVVRVSYQGRNAVRDIVQFVPFNEFWELLVTGNPDLAKQRLTESVLAEVPTQLVSYMSMRGIKPVGNCIQKNRVNPRQASPAGPSHSPHERVLPPDYGNPSMLEPPPPYAP